MNPSGPTRHGDPGRPLLHHVQGHDLPFDIDQFISSCTGGILGPYFQAIQRADNAALESFRSEVIRHKRQPQKTRYAAQRTPQGIHRLSPHDEYLLKAIWWEKTKRSRLRMWIYETILPIRKAWLFCWRGMELKENEYLGYVTIGRKKDYGIFPYVGIRMTIFKMARETQSYIVRHHWKIISAVIAIATLYVMWLGQQTAL